MDQCVWDTREPELEFNSSTLLQQQPQLPVARGSSGVWSWVKVVGPLYCASSYYTSSAFVGVCSGKLTPPRVEEASQVNAMSRHLGPSGGYFKLCSLTRPKNTSSCGVFWFLPAVENPIFIELIKCNN